MTPAPTDSAPMNKAALRQRARDILLSYSREEFQQRNDQVLARLRALPAYRTAAHVAMYVGVGREVGTAALLAEILERNAYVCLPVWIKEERVYRFARHRAGETLLPGPLGIPQPASEDYVTVSTLDLVIVPGVAFSPNGARLGHGGGYYDRMLAPTRDEAAVLKVGLALQGQIFDTLPREATDVPLDVVLTDENEYTAGHSEVP